MRKSPILVSLFATLALAACKLEVAPDVYLTDLQGVTPQAPITTSVILRLEAISAQDCAEKRDFFRDGLAQGFENVVFRDCVDENFDTFAEFEAETTLAVWDRYTLFERFIQNKPALFLMVIDERSARGVFGAANFTAIEAIQRRLSETDGRYTAEFTDRLSISFGAEIINDTREEQILATGQNFYNGDPVYRQNSFSLNYRRSASVRISDVANAALMKGETVYLFSLLDVQEIPDDEKTAPQLQEALPEE